MRKNDLPPAEKLRSKGELVEASEFDELNPDLHDVRNNPLKTPPNKYTTKNRVPNEKD